MPLTGSTPEKRANLPDTVPGPAQEIPPVKIRAGSRRRVWTWALVAVGLIGLCWGWWRFASPSPSPSPERARPHPVPTKARSPEKQLQVVSTQGTVEHRRPGETSWQPIVPGKLIAADESIKTSKNAVVALQIDEKSKIELQKRSVLTVGQLGEQTHRFVLDQGRVRLDYQEDSGREVQIQGSEAEIFTRVMTGEVTIQNNQTTLSVVARKGLATLESQSGVISVTSGMSAAVSAGESPVLVRPIPNTVMLKVTGPKSRIQRARSTVITGKTGAGAIVRVNDVLARVDREGRFWVRIPLNTGSNRIVVQTEDVAGNTTNRELPAIVVDPKASIDRIKLRWRTDDPER